MTKINSNESFKVALSDTTLYMHIQIFSFAYLVNIVVFCCQVVPVSGYF